MNSPRRLRALAIILGVVLVLVLALFVVQALGAEGERADTVAGYARHTYLGGNSYTGIYLLEWQGREFMFSSKGGIIEVTR